MPFEPAAAPSSGPFYEVWFLKLNDPATRDALWLRYVRSRGERDEASLWYLLFDHREGVRAGRWERPAGELTGGPGRPFSLPLGSLSEGRAEGRGPEAAWSLAFRPEPLPEFRFVPAWMRATGLAKTDYRTPFPYARFDGWFEHAGRRWEFKDAPGSVGHLWGRRMAPQWRWGHACLQAPDGSPGAFELLSARVPLPGGRLSPELTAAHLYWRGVHHVSAGAAQLLSNRSEGRGDRWGFRVRFPGLVAEGSWRQDPRLTANVLYRDPGGSLRCCRNCKTGGLQLTLSDGRGRSETLAVPDAAAFEWVDQVIPAQRELALA